MDKRIEFSSVDSLGKVFAEAIDITRKGGGLEKIAGHTHPEVTVYLRDLRPDPQYQYVLMTPMGAFEYWGMNANGDIFPELALSFHREKDDPLAFIRELEARWLIPHGNRVPPSNYTNFGHKTFLEALRYRHHANKNPAISYGDITLAVWNPSMRRVEVIARHDREKAKRVSAEDIIKDLDEGKPRQISMGCKVPFDVCTLCGHISRTPTDYCDHLRMMMGSTLPDGRVVGAVNLFPRFFDLSDVFIPAARESGVLMKVAEQKVQVPVTKSAASQKIADLTKTVLPNSVKSVLTRTMAQEPVLPKTLLRDHDLDTLLSTLAALGIVLKPQEFQYSVLTRAGKGDLAEQLWDSHEVFRPTAPVPRVAGASFSAPSPSLMERLAPLLAERSGFYPHLPQRILRVVVTRGVPTQELGAAADSPILQKVAHLYGEYRSIFSDLPRLLSTALESEYDYYQTHFFHELLSDAMEKVSASYHKMDLSTPLVPLYFYNAHQSGVVVPPPTWNFEVPSNSQARALLFPVL